MNKQTKYKVIEKKEKRKIKICFIWNIFASTCLVHEGIFKQFQNEL